MTRRTNSLIRDFGQSDDGSSRISRVWPGAETPPEASCAICGPPASRSGIPDSRTCSDGASHAHCPSEVALAIDCWGAGALPVTRWKLRFVILLRLALLHMVQVVTTVSTLAVVDRNRDAAIRSSRR
jgi:hypothetical protein